MADGENRGDGAASERPPRRLGLIARTTPRSPARSAFEGTAGLAINGGALIINVFAAGLGGFAFWVIAARSVDPAVVAQTSAMLTTMLGVVTMSQQSLVINIPILIAGSPQPRRLAAHAYVAALSLTALGALLYLVVGTRLGSGIGYLRDLRLSVAFFFGCLVWSVFSLQDAVLTGLRRARIVLLENTTWATFRLVVVLAVPLVGLELGIGWLVAAWLAPAALLVATVTYYLFVKSNSPLRQSLGSHDVHLRTLFSFLGVEHLAAITNGLAQIVTPAVALTTLGARAAAPFLAAYSLIVVTEGALGAFSGAFAVEVRRHGFASRNLIAMTFGLLGGFSLVAVLGAQFYGDNLMGLFGHEYREPGGAVLAILVLGIPANCVRFVASAANRLRRAGWRNFAQQGSYCATLLVGFSVANVQTGRSLAACLVAARFVAAAVSLHNLNKIRSIRARAAAAAH